MLSSFCLAFCLASAGARRTVCYHPNMAHDLRSFLDVIKRTRPDDLVVVSREVDPTDETTALVTLEQEPDRDPIALKDYLP